jgi:glycerophosphoryl diester phosphodiesterase
MTDVTLVTLVLAGALTAWRWPLWRGRDLPGVTRPKPWGIGHRGVRGPLPENSLAAFRRALDAGLDGLETDVQRTRDGALVLVHDEVVTGVRVAEALEHEVAAVVPALARLDELLALVRDAPGTLLNVELKTSSGRARALPRAVARALRESGIEDRVLVSSFDPLALARFRLAAPHVRTAYLWLDRPATPRALRRPWPAPWLHVDALHAHHAAVDAELVARARERNLALNVWTVNDPQEIRRLLALGVSGIMSDDPDLLREAMRGGSP